MRPSHGIALLFLMSACSLPGGANDAASASAAAPASASVSAQALPSASAPAAEPDWSALPSLEGMVTATAPLTAAWPTRFASATVDGIWLPNMTEGAAPAVARLDVDTLEVTATIDLGGEAGTFPPDAQATTPGANGVWVALAYQRAVALIDPETNSISRRIEVDGAPYSLVEDGDTLWIVDFENSNVLAIDIATGEERLRIGTLIEPIEMAVGEGSVWVAEHDLGNIVRLDSTTGDEVARVHVGGRPGVVIGFGSVWARSDDDRIVARIDPATNSVVATIPMPINTADLEVAGDSVWVSASPQRGACERNSYLVRIDPASNEADGIMDLPCAFGLASDGTRLWTGSFDGDETSILRVDPGAQP